MSEAEWSEYLSAGELPSPQAQQAVAAHGHPGEWVQADRGLFWLCAECDAEYGIPS